MKKFIKKNEKNIREKGYITTPYGRKIYCDSNLGYKSANYDVQGSGGDVIKKAMIELGRMYKEENVPAYTLLTVHDDIVIEVPIKHLTSKFAKKVIDIMETQPELKIVKRLPVSMSLIEKTWAEKIEIKDLKEIDKWRQKKLMLATKSVT